MKSRFKNVTGFDTSKFTEKNGSASLKSNVDKFNIEKLKKNTK